MKMQAILGQKGTLYFLSPTPCPKTRTRATDGTGHVPQANAPSFSLFCVRAQGTLAT